MLTNEIELIDSAICGNKMALETLLISVQDLVYNLSLRMLGTISDAEDATQEIIIRIITHLSSFRKESAFSTWVYRIAINHLLNYKKSLFAQHPLNFEAYGEDIQKGFIENMPDLLQNVEENILAEELKISCTNIMLQCFDVESRCIYILGTMFKVDSKVAGDIMGLSPETYRQRLSRIRKKMAGFLSTYCGLASGICNCQKRVGYAIASRRLDPSNLEYSALEKLDEFTLMDCKDAMENLDTLSLQFAGLPKYRSSKKVKSFLMRILESNDMQIVKGKT